MKVPLIASINKRTINLETKELMVKMYRNGQATAVKSPFVPYYYTEDRRETKRLIASDKTVNLKKHLYPVKTIYQTTHSLMVEGKHYSKGYA
ncbi:MAG: hypothetical protein CM15mV52_0280 [uncultured marine virus]|nr:MAG: hypothetical protein CM15mV52_0280 [uncultured marine virus]